MSSDGKLGGLANKSILIIDDEDVDVIFFRRAFRSVAPDLKLVDTTESERAIELVASTKPDVVILDLRMPGKNGLEILEALRKDPENDCRPILMISNSDRAEDVRACLQRRANAYSVKPSTIAEYKSYASAVVGFWLFSSLTNI